jgi:hypothetical protein
MANQVEVDANQLKIDAKAAFDNGRRYFTPALVTTYFGLGRSRGMDDWSYFIRLIEDEGWKLEHWEVSVPTTAAAIAFPVFVRA